MRHIPVRIGIDTAKSVFQLHGIDRNEFVVLRRHASLSKRSIPPASRG